MTHHGEYLLDNRQTQAGQRFAALSNLFDASTFRHFERLGVATGWRCWEVGAGGLSVPTWLAERVGSTGSVVATDIDISWMTAHPPEIDVRQHDVGIDAPPDVGFDLVHARLVLVHVAERDAAMHSMVDALRPGGWLLIEDADPALQPLICIDEYGPAQVLANRLRRGFRTLMSERGVDLAFGRTLPRQLRDVGLLGVEADAFFPITGPECVALESATIEQIRERLVTGGLATTAEIDEHLANVAAGELDLATSPMISAWGRKPA